MAKQPAFQFYPGDWLQDTRVLTPATRGIWIDMLCFMWRSPERGKLSFTYEQYARLLSCNIEEIKSSITELNLTNVGLISENGDKIIIENRRMVNEEKDRISGKKRQRMFREKGGGDPDRWTAIRIPILLRDKYMCAYCGRKADTVDHVFPKSKGGDENEYNLVACCKRCNMQKNNRTLEDSKLKFWDGFKYKTQISHQYNTYITPSSSSSSSKKIIEEVANAPSSSPERFQKTAHGDVKNKSTIFIELPLNDGSTHMITADVIAEMSRLYPAVDVEQEFRSMRGWLLAKPVRRKTKRGIKAFYTSWLSRKQDNGGHGNQQRQLPERNRERKAEDYQFDDADVIIKSG